MAITKPVVVVTISFVPCHASPTLSHAGVGVACECQRDGKANMMSKKRLRILRLLVLCLATIAVFLTLYFTAVSTRSTYVTATGTKMTTHPFSNSSHVGYLMALSYGGQQAAAVGGLAKLQNWVKNARLPMLIVEPFINNSTLGTYGECSQQSIKFSDMFDLENFNRVSRSDGVAEMVAWDTYVTHAHHDAILVRCKKFPERRKGPPSAVLWTTQPGSSECWQSEGGYADVWLSNKRLCYIRVVLVTEKLFTSPTFSAKDVHATILAGINPTTVTIVFEQWCAPWTPKSPLFLPPDRAHSSGSSADIRNYSMFLTQRLQDSPRILRDVRNYKKQFLKKIFGQSYVAVMLRAEHALLKHLASKGEKNYNYFSARLQTCLDEVVKKTSDMKAKLGTKNVFVTADVGLYGSNTWQKTSSRTHLNASQLAKVEMQVKHTVERLYNDQQTFEEWEKSFSQATGGMEDKGYIAAVQRGVASQASGLILLGGGDFHTLTLKGYVDRTKPQNRYIDFVCIHKYSATQVMYTLKDG